MEGLGEALEVILGAKVLVELARILLPEAVVVLADIPGALETLGDGGNPDLWGWLGVVLRQLGR